MTLKIYLGFLLKFKSDVLTTFKHFKAVIENLIDQKIKILRTDCGGEYKSKAFAKFCFDKGITCLFFCPHTTQQNGVAERKHRLLVECALT